MQILISLHNESINPILEPSFLYPLSTKDLPNYYQSTCYSDVGKFLYCCNQHLLTDEILGVTQNRRFLYNIINPIYKKSDKIVNYIDILKNYDIIVCKLIASEPNALFHFCHYDMLQYFKGSEYKILNFMHDLYNIFTNDELTFLLNSNKMIFHSLFVTKNEIFYNYGKYLKEKITLFSQLPSIKEILNKNNYTFCNKLYSWLTERLLNTFCYTYNLKIYYENMIEYHTKDYLKGQYTIYTGK